MRIAQVSHSLDCGGSMAMVVALSAGLVREGNEVDVICTDRSTGSDHEAMWVDRLAKSKVTVHFLGRKRGYPGVLAAAKLGWLIQSRRYDVVHSHLPMPDAISGLVRRYGPCRFDHFITVHNTHEPRSAVLATLASGANVVYCSEAVRKRNPLPGVSGTVIPNGIPQTLYAMPMKSRQETRKQLGLSADAKVVIVVGRMCPQKDFDTAIEVVGMVRSRDTVPALQCLLCGEGEEKERLERRVEQMKLGAVVRFLGARTDIPDLLQASDVFLSTSRYEGMPLTVLEALSAGLPCVLTAIDEHHEVAASMAGCLFSSRAPELMASALESMLRDAPAHEELREKRAASLQKHSIEECVKSYQSLYHACITRRYAAEPLRS